MARAQSQHPSKSPRPLTSNTPPSPRTNDGPLRSPSTLLHEAVNDIVNGLAGVLARVERYSYLSHGLSVLDQHRDYPEAEEKSDPPDGMPTWRAVIDSLRTAVCRANELWDIREPDSGTPARFSYSVATSGPVTCGPLIRNSHHDLVIAAGRLILDPLDADAITEDEVKPISACGVADAVSSRLVARVQVVRELRTQGWCHATRLHLDREFAAVESRRRDQRTAQQSPAAKAISFEWDEDRAIVREGSTIVRVRGKRSVALMRAVVEADGAPVPLERPDRIGAGVGWLRT